MSDRKFRLLGVAACRRVWDLIADPRSRAAVEAAELHADGLIDDARLDAALEESCAASYDAEGREGDAAGCKFAIAVDSLAQLSGPQPRYEGWLALTHIAEGLAILHPESVVEGPAFPPGDMAYGDDPNFVFTTQLSLEEQEAQAALMREILGNPFRPATINPAWLTWHDSLIPQLAQHIYEQRKFEDLPILSDALIDAGCTNQEIIDHCRAPGPHVRGCWVVDLLTGRS